MPNEELLTIIDERLAVAMPLIEEIQNNYMDKHGVYAQALFTHSQVPAEDEMVSPDSLSEKPTDQDETWEDLAQGILPENMYTRMKIDTYASQDGQGYVVVPEKEVDDTVYVRKVNVGPETNRGHGWQKHPVE